LPILAANVSLQGTHTCYVCGRTLDWKFEGNRGGAIYSPAEMQVTAIDGNQDAVTFQVELQCTNGCGRTNRFTHTERRNP
jgi:penicillin V acylase-like amidase (Ntn superfamily)